MTIKETRYEEYEVEICENCGHEASLHYNKPKKAFNPDGEYVYTAIGCMVISENGNRKLPGENIHLRCNCLKVK